MAATFGYGKRLFVQGLARICCKIARYLVKHNAKLTTALAGNADATACLASLLSCAVTLCNLLNVSER
jgi:phage gp36-like protein